MAKIIESPCGNVTSLPDDDISNTIYLTENAKKKIADILEENPGHYFRIAVQGGGCSGFQYLFALDSEKDDDDFVLEANVLIDDMSMTILKGATLNYKKELSGEAFEIVNPNVSSSCGCNNSFSLPSDYFGE